MTKRLTENLTSIDIESFRRKGLLNGSAINVITTPCRYGGKRHWFLCPACKRRVGILYKDGSYLKCRKCCDLTYRSRLERKTGLLYHATNVLRMSERINDLESNQKRSKYKGKPTRKQRKLDKLITLAKISSVLVKMNHKK